MSLPGASQLGRQGNPFSVKPAPPSVIDVFKTVTAPSKITPKSSGLVQSQQPILQLGEALFKAETPGALQFVQQESPAKPRLDSSELADSAVYQNWLAEGGEHKHTVVSARIS